MFNIGQFSQFVKVSPRMLRYYEKCGLFYPAEIDKINGYRLYSATQIPLILRITALRDMGFTIDEISSILDSFEEENVIISALENKRMETEKVIADKYHQIDLLKTTMNKVSNGNFTTSCQEISIKSIPRLSVIALLETVSDYSLQEQLWKKLFGFINDNNLSSLIEETAITIYHDMIQKEKDFKIEVAVVLKEQCDFHGTICCRELEALETAACVMCEGPYERVLPEGELLLAGWIDAHHYMIIGSERVYSYKHPYNEQDPNKYQTEIIFPVRKKEM